MDLINKEAKWKILKKRIGQILSLLLFTLMGVLFISEGDILLGISVLIGVLISVWVIFFYKPISPTKSNKYVPGKSYMEYRASPEQKVKMMNYSQLAIGVLMAGILVIWWEPILLGDAPYLGKGLAGGIGILLTLQYMKGRIKHHKQLDDATAFELEEQGVITPYEIPKALYKDFSSWDDLKKGNKIILTTQDRLKIIRMETRYKANKIELSLKDIDNFTISNYDNEGKGLILSFGTYDNKTMQVVLEGNSDQDSPEEFVRFFMEQLDQVLLGKESAQSGQAIVTRQVDIQSVGIAADSNAEKHITLPTLHIEDKTEEVFNQNQRYIDL